MFGFFVGKGLWNGEGCAKMEERGEVAKMLGERFFRSKRAESVGSSSVDETAQAWQELANLGQMGAGVEGANAGVSAGAETAEASAAEATEMPVAAGDGGQVNVEAPAAGGEVPNGGEMSGGGEAAEEEETWEESLARWIKEEATELFQKYLPGLSEKGREQRLQRAVQAGLSRMDGTRKAQERFLASRGEELTEEAEEEIADRAATDVGHIIESYYKEGSRIRPEGAGDEMSEDEELGWELAAEPHVPGTLNLTMLFEQNPRREGESVEEYKQRLHNYSRQDLVREEQLRKDAEYEQQAAKERAEKQEMERQQELKRLARLSEEAQRRISTCEDLKVRMRLIEASAKITRRMLELQETA